MRRLQHAVPATGAEHVWVPVLEPPADKALANRVLVALKEVVRREVAAGGAVNPLGCGVANWGIAPRKPPCAMERAIAGEGAQGLSIAADR